MKGPRSSYTVYSKHISDPEHPSENLWEHKSIHPTDLKKYRNQTSELLSHNYQEAMLFSQFKLHQGSWRHWATTTNEEKFSHRERGANG